MGSVESRPSLSTCRKKIREFDDSAVRYYGSMYLALIDPHTGVFVATGLKI